MATLKEVYAALEGLTELVPEANEKMSRDEVLKCAELAHAGLRVYGALSSFEKSFKLSTERYEKLKQQVMKTNSDEKLVRELWAIIQSYQEQE